ncbi:MAG TPA: hypothetical protein PK504_09230 [Ferruginibacter sp.]|nr:hypothetical protein [Ferruginibacter sp.]HRE63139.1 hypothetical protein [Ferruginibacter sp.]
MKKILVITLTFLLLNFFSVSAQYKSYKISVKGDTINAMNAAGKKVGKWINRIEELRGEPGYEEEGEYKDGAKAGSWRMYSLEGDLLGIENYKNGGKDGTQQYFTYLGDLLREENWRGYDPEHPYDTIPVYGTGSNEIVDMKIVKAEQYSVRHGIWKYFEPGTGRLIKEEEYDRNVVVKPKAKEKEEVANTDPSKKKEIQKTPEMLEWEKKNRGKKNAIRDGKTGL